MLCEVCSHLLRARLIEIKCDDDPKWQADTGPVRLWLVAANESPEEELSCASDASVTSNSREITRGGDGEGEQLAIPITQLVRFTLEAHRSTPDPDLSFSIGTTHCRPFLHHRRGRFWNQYSNEKCIICSTIRDHGNDSRIPLGSWEICEDADNELDIKLSSVRPMCVFHMPLPSASHAPSMMHGKQDADSHLRSGSLSADLTSQSVPADVQTNEQDCSIIMTLVYFEQEGLNIRMSTCSSRMEFVQIFQPAPSNPVRTLSPTIPSQMIPSADIGPCKNSERWFRALEKIRSWMASCSEHSRCKEGYQTTEGSSERIDLPSRLIRIDGTARDLSVRLVECQDLISSETDVKYATLSHRWSSTGDFAKLTTANYAQFLSDISLRDLPRTFRDAFYVASAIGSRYIWIDALCIIQDSKDDWLHEAPRMAIVYSKSTVNIAATGATKNDDGLFTQSSILDRPYVSPSWDTQELPKGLWLPSSRSGLNESCHEEQIGEASLNKRGWVFQERALSPRVLHFARDQFWWECHEVLENESNASRVKRVNQESYLWLISEGDWQFLVRDYSNTEFTFWSDKLIASAGLAEAFAVQNNRQSQDYAAGLWKQSFRQDLMWYCAAHHHPRRITDAYVAPTWSWASVKSMVFFIWEIGNNTYHDTFSILHISIDLAGDSHFGQVRDGFVRCAGLIHKITYSKGAADGESTLSIGEDDYTEWDDESDENGMPLCSDGIFKSFELNLDDWNKVDKGDHLQAFFIPAVQQRYKVTGAEFLSARLAGLVLEKVADRVGVFKRIGLLVLATRGTAIQDPFCWKQGGDFADDSYFKPADGGAYEVKIV